MLGGVCHQGVQSPLLRLGYERQQKPVGHAYRFDVSLRLGQVWVYYLIRTHLQRNQ